jgi:hypothetical protein
MIIIFAANKLVSGHLNYILTILLLGLDRIREVFNMECETHFHLKQLYLTPKLSRP